MYISEGLHHGNIFYTTKNEKRKKYLTHYLSDKGFNGTIVNRTLPSLHGGSLEITLIHIQSLFYSFPDDPEKT